MKLHQDALRTQTAAGLYQDQSFAQNMPSMNPVRRLTEEDRLEVIEFLAERPVHTVVMTSFIQDNGIESPDNRGSFYGYRDELGILEGIALIGHTTLIEARSVNALASFALKARESEISIHLMMSDGNSIESFWKFYAGPTMKPRMVCTELLFELRFPFLVKKCNLDVRPARAEELHQIAAAHAEVAFMESGVDPMIKDREGFLRRCKRRIENERTFVVFDEGKLVFKADIVAETENVIYLEGIYVSPEHRGRGIGPQCLSRFSLDLLERVQHICLLSNVDFKGAHKSFVKSGFVNTDECQTIFV